MKLPKIITLILRRRARRLVKKRPADLAIGGRDNPYLNRWYVIPRNRWLNIYLHQMLRDDDDRALHDHPWWSLSVCLRGEIREVLTGGQSRLFTTGDVVVRSARMAHRLELEQVPAMTLFITGPRLREWGFHCPENSPAGGWRHWKDFTDSDDSAKIGRGCGE